MAHRNLQFGRYDYAGFSAFTMYSVCSLAIPLMIVAMGNSLNFPLDQGGMAAGGVLHVVRSIFMVAALLVCGTISARLGKRITMGGCLILFGTGIMLCAFTSAYWMLLPCLMLAGFGEGICEGILTPFIQDLHPKAPERYVNIAHSFWSIGVVVTVLAAGALLSWGVSWRLILLLAGVLALVPALLFLLPSRGARHPDKPEKLHWTTVWGHATTLMKQPRFWLFFAAMVLAGGGEFCLTFWVASFIELSFDGTAWTGGPPACWWWPGTPTPRRS